LRSDRLEEIVMTDARHAPERAAQSNQTRFLSILVLPFAGCMISSVAGIVLGQVGNLLYKALGQAGNCLALPGLCGLFVVTFGLSFLSNRLLKTWLVRSGR
jgi:hypothetical protein